MGFCFTVMMFALMLKYLRGGLGIATFVVYAVFGVFFSWIVFPILAFCSPSHRVGVLRVRLVVHYLFRGLVGWLTVIGLLKLHVQSSQKLSEIKGKLLLANHPTFLDVVFLISLFPNANCLVKSQLRKNVFFAGIIRYADYIHNDAVDDMLDRCQQSLLDGDVLIVFPEGTRTTPGQSMVFLRGAANIAIRTNADLLLVTLCCQPLVFTKQHAWYSIMPGLVHFSVCANQQLALADFALEGLEPSMAARRLTKQLQSYFTQELRQHG
jgi:1-acyl-sn-glycerol-3-phosphate acyltransferase